MGPPVLKLKDVRSETANPASATRKNGPGIDDVRPPSPVFAPFSGYKEAEGMSRRNMHLEKEKQFILTNMKDSVSLRLPQAFRSEKGFAARDRGASDQPRQGLSLQACLVSLGHLR